MVLQLDMMTNIGLLCLIVIAAPFIITVGAQADTGRSLQDYSTESNQTNAVTILNNGADNSTTAIPECPQRCVHTLKRVGIMIGAGFASSLGFVFVLLPLTLCICGCACGGIRDGSCAAGCQSSIGDVEKGSCFACCQSTGAGGSCKAMIIGFFVIGIIMAVILGYADGKECFDDRCPKSYGEQFRYGVMKILYPKSYTESVP